MKITQIPSCIQVFVLNKINFQSKLEFYSKAWFLFFFFFVCCYFLSTENNAPLHQIFRTDANSWEWSRFTLLLKIFTAWITKLSQKVFLVLWPVNTQVKIHTTYNQPSQTVSQPTIWPPTTKYLLLTSHLSAFSSGRGSGSAAYCYRQLAFHSKTFPLWLIHTYICAGLVTCADVHYQERSKNYKSMKHW